MNEIRYRVKKTVLKVRLPMGKHQIRLSLYDLYECKYQLKIDEKCERPLKVNLELIKNF